MQDKKLTEMKDEIRSYLAKKDHYDIMGIPKTATDAQIKKAYRHLALRFHPDKNSVQGAKDVFKKISNAYTVLIDSEKRAHYDRFGPQQERPQPQYHNYQANYGHADHQYEDFDDIFRVFFGGIPMHHRRRHAQPQAYRQQYQQNGQQVGYNFYYIFVIFFLIYTIIPLFQRSPSYSSSPNYEHRIRKTTSKLNVEFYVNQNYMQQAKNPQFKKKAEMTIDKQYIIQLEQNCQYVKKQKKTLQSYAYQQSAGATRQAYLNRAKSIDMSYCHLLSQIRSNYQDYVTELMYFR